MKPLLLGLWLAHGADAAVTHYAITERNAKEIILPTQNVYVIDTVAFGQALFTSLGLSYLDKNQHPRAARIIGWSIVGVRSVVVAHNIAELRKR